MSTPSPAEAPLGTVPRAHEPLPQSPGLLIVRLGAMGDVIHGLPAVAALRAAFPGSAVGLADRRALGGIAVHLAHAALGPAFGAASAGGPGSHREHPAVARRAFFRRNLGTRRRQLERFAGQRDMKLPSTFRVRCVRLCWRGGRERLSFTDSAQPRENLASMFYTRQVIAARRTRCGTESVARRSGRPAAAESLQGRASHRRPLPSRSATAG